VQDIYDGALPPADVPEVSLEKDDIDLMWHLFDYALMSKLPSNDWSLEAPTRSASHHQTPGMTNDATLNAKFRGSKEPTIISQDALPIDTATEDIFHGQFQDFDFG
jgi:hypothetical protein